MHHHLKLHSWWLDPHLHHGLAVLYRCLYCECICLFPSLSASSLPLIPTICLCITFIAFSSQHWSLCMSYTTSMVLNCLSLETSRCVPGLLSEDAHFEQRRSSPLPLSGVLALCLCLTISYAKYMIFQWQLLFIVLQYVSPDAPDHSSRCSSFSATFWFLCLILTLG